MFYFSFYHMTEYYTNIMLFLSDSLLLLQEETVKNGTKIELNHDFFCKPFPSAHIGDAPRDLTQFW